MHGVSVWQALERLCKRIRDEQAKGREGEDWSVAKGYIRSVLHGLALANCSEDWGVRRRGAAAGIEAGQ